MDRHVICVIKTSTHIARWHSMANYALLLWTIWAKESLKRRLMKQFEQKSLLKGVWWHNPYGVTTVSWPRRVMKPRTIQVPVTETEHTFGHHCAFLGPVAISEKTSYRKISWSLEATRFVFRIVRSLWNLTGTSAAMLPMCLSNFKANR